MKIVSVVGARPNFMKIAPFVRAIEEYNRRQGGEEIEHILVHTGQHYDDRMSKAFFQDLGIPEADINLGVGSGSHAEQVGHTMIEFEKVVKREKPHWVVVVGDVNATLACSVTAKKEHLLCCHIEAGLRSGDITMPEEVNRLVTDRLSDLLLIPDRLSGDNLRREGVPEKSIVFTGNIMIDTLEANRERAAKMVITDILEKNRMPGGQLPALADGGYALLTMHRPSNVDHADILGPIVDFLIDEVASDMPLLWTLHPRTGKQLRAFGLYDKVAACSNIILLHPLGYHDMLRLNMGARILLTDSGGLQEECTVLGTPCLTLRWNTERPVTLREHGGASVLVGNSVDRIRAEYQAILEINRKPERPEMWDGKTAMRCLEAIMGFRELKE